MQLDYCRFSCAESRRARRDDSLSQGCSVPGHLASPDRIPALHHFFLSVLHFIFHQGCVSCQVDNRMWDAGGSEKYRILKFLFSQMTS